MTAYKKYYHALVLLFVPALCCAQMQQAVKVVKTFRAAAAPNVVRAVVPAAISAEKLAELRALYGADFGLQSKKYSVLHYPEGIKDPSSLTFSPQFLKKIKEESILSKARAYNEAVFFGQDGAIVSEAEILTYYKEAGEVVSGEQRAKIINQENFGDIEDAAQVLKGKKIIVYNPYKEELEQLQNLAKKYPQTHFEFYNYGGKVIDVSYWAKLDHIKYDAVIVGYYDNALVIEGGKKINLGKDSENLLFSPGFNHVQGKYMKKIIYSPVTGLSHFAKDSPAKLVGENWNSTDIPYTYDGIIPASIQDPFVEVARMFNAGK